MTHDEAIELLELAAAEPDGLERLAAGDRPEAAALAGHLAGCPTCLAEHDALRRLAVVLRAILPEMPPDDLRERTLGAVADLGRPRSAVAQPSIASVGPPAPAAAAATPPAAAPAPTAAPPLAAGHPEGFGIRPSPGRQPLLRLAALAAAIVLAVGIGFVGGSQSREGELEQRALVVTSLERLASASLAIAAAPDARNVALTSADGRATGRVLFSAQSSRLVVIATGLEPPPRGELRCWVEVGGERTVVGRMVFADDLAYWAGPAEVLSKASDSILFGISLVLDGSAPGAPILEGRP